MGVFDVPATDLIKETAKEFKEKLTQPAWSYFIKTGAHKERAPLNSNWWFERLASVLYRVYKDGPVGVQSLRTYYGGKRNRGVKPSHFKKASGKIVRNCLQELEKAGYLKKAKKGRTISAQGEKLLAQKAKIVEENLKKQPVKEKELKTEKTVSEEEKKVKEALKKQDKEKKSKEKKEEKKPEKGVKKAKEESK